MGKEAFKQFVKKNPNLASYVASGNMTWQKFYELYDMYGENSVIWDPYQASINTNTKEQIPRQNGTLKEPSWKDIVQMVKGIDLSTVQKGIDHMQKAIALVQDLTKPTPAATPYEPRPLYKYFED